MGNFLDDDAHFELLWQRVPLGGIPRTLGGSMSWLLPNLQALVVAQGSANPKVFRTLLMKTKNRINAASLQFGHECPGAQAGVTQQYIALME